MLMFEMYDGALMNANVETTTAAAPIMFMSFHTFFLFILRLISAVCCMEFPNWIQARAATPKMSILAV